MIAVRLLVVAELLESANRGVQAGLRLALAVLHRVPDVANHRG